MELVQIELLQHDIAKVKRDIPGIGETHWKGDRDSKYGKMIWFGEREKSHNSVGFLLSKKTEKWR